MDSQLFMLDILYQRVTRVSSECPLSPSGRRWSEAVCVISSQFVVRFFLKGQSTAGKVPPWKGKLVLLIFNLTWCFSLVVSDSLQPHGLQHARPPCPSPTPGVYSNSCPLSLWCHPTISSSVVPFSSYLQSFPASGTFPVSQFFASGGQSIGVSASASVLPMNIQDWFPLEGTGWISLQSKGLSRIFFNTTFQKHQFFGAQLSL